MDAEQQKGMTDQLPLFGEEAMVAPLERWRGRKPICAYRGAASDVGVGRDSSPGNRHPDGDDL